MKKYIIILVIIAAVATTALVYNANEVGKKSVRTFKAEGYILNSKQEDNIQKVEKYYFKSDEKYKKQYDNTIAFKDTTGEKIVVDDANFLHYTNGAISSLTKGVIMDLSGIDDDPIIYYTIAANNDLTKVNNNYLIKRANQDLSFREYIWKISDNKYLICGSPLTLNFATGDTKEINGYIELEYVDNEIVKLYNQEVTYQTVSSDIYITVLDGIKINLANKIVSKDGENKMSLENMIINSDDNVEIIDINDDKYKEETEEYEEDTEDEENDLEKNENENGNKNENNNNNNNNENNAQTNNNEGGNGRKIDEEQYEKLEELLQRQEEMKNEEQNYESTQQTQTQTQQTTTPQQQTSTGTTEVIIEETAQFTAPTFSVEKLEVDAISVEATITVTDEKEALSEDPLIRIIRNDTGKIVYETEENKEKMSIEVATANLTPNTEYTLNLQASFQLDEAVYTRNFIYKMFRTEPVGIELEKNYFTNDVLSFKCNIAENSNIDNAEIVLMNMQGETLERRAVYSTDIVEFENLTPNTEYIVQIQNVKIDNQNVSGIFDTNQYKTLKNKPSVSGTQFEIDKRNSRFLVWANKIDDPNGGILSCRYEVYDVRMQTEDSEPVLIINTNRNEQAVVPVDGKVIQRDIGYAFKLVVEFYDNEKIVELESEYSDIMIMNAAEFPSVTFEPLEVTFEHIKGTLVVKDDSNTIDLTSSEFTIVYTDSVGARKTFTSDGSLNIPVDILGLKANETYKFEVFTTVDLHDQYYDDEGNNVGIRENCYIGGAVVKTEEAQALVASFRKDTNNYKDAFSIVFQLKDSEGNDCELEASTLAGMTFTIYAGQNTDGTPFRAPLNVRDAKDKEGEEYESTIKENYYDKSVIIDPAFLGYNNKDFRDRYYTITVTNAYDYTLYKNKIPIENNTFLIECNGSSPDLPADVNDALNVQEIKNRSVQLRDDLDPNTTVGYKVTAKFNSTEVIPDIVRYCVYDATTNKLMAIQDITVGEDGRIPSAVFNIEDGTFNNINDSENGLEIDDTNKDATVHNREFEFTNQELRRGNKYYFAYFMWFDLDNDGNYTNLYPYIEENTLLRSPEFFPIKQEPKIFMYPSTSTSNSITYKYTVTDVDNCLISDQMTANIGNNIKDTKEFVISQPDEVQTEEITFGNLVPGDFSVTISSKNNKVEQSTDTVRKICNYYFEGKVNLNRVEYTVKVESNKVMVTLQNVENNLNRIAAVDVQFLGNNNKVKNKQFISPTSETISIDLSELEDFKKENITINVFVHYDNGLIGFDMDSDYKLFEKNYLSGNTRYYYNLNSENVLVPVPSASGKMYIASIENKVLTLSPPSNPSKIVPINLMVMESGYAYEYELFNQKQVARVQIEPDGTNVISFDDIIPSITMKNIVSELSEIRFKADILIQGSTQILNNLFYVDIYRTDANGSNEEFVRTEEVRLDQFGDYISLSPLEPKNYYAFRVRTKMVGEGQTVKEEYLYDTQQQIVGRTYYASTLADVGISGITVKYNPISYEEKTIDIEYNLEEIFGYDKIVYVIQRWNPEINNYETILDNIEDTLFKKRMIKKINCPPGSVFTFDEKYNVIIKPIAVLEESNGTTKELEVGTESYEFKLAALSNPFVGIKGIREANHVVAFKITIYDDSKIVVGNEYSIKILNGRNEDITPEQYKDQTYSTSLLNNRIELQNTEYTEGYTIKVILKVDRENSGENLYDLERSYRILPVNENGISVGTITATNNASDRSKIDLVFYESTKLTEITNIKYSIYNINGYSTNGTAEFIPTRIGSDEDTIYKYTINKSLEDVGRYYIELQFLKEDFVMETYSLEYTYLGD